MCCCLWVLSLLWEHNGVQSVYTHILLLTASNSVSHKIPWIHSVVYSITVSLNQPSSCSVLPDRKKKFPYIADSSFDRRNVARRRLVQQTHVTRWALFLPKSSSGCQRESREVTWYRNDWCLLALKRLLHYIVGVQTLVDSCFFLLLQMIQGV